MSSRPVKFIASAIGLAIVLAASAPADAAKSRKHKKVAAVHASEPVRPQAAYRGANLFPAGPVYFGQDYLGDDPDPFIRLQLYRDLGAHFGGDN